ncbi:hypothetical protein [Microvirga aerophila]|uniref:Uncharacterized protein n=1 Tax=Microvirga aerophila TaxID=670291 RepID=A0A512C383_9HYPH|nr:hypothetical protein [Microvirga aerophila]GEO18674.1 hypothetical protein MAE02_63700 [Microvirga aerophila]
MSLHSAHEYYYDIAAQDALQIPTVLICDSFLMREGIKHLLSKTQFQIQDEAVDRPSGFPGFPDAKAILFLIG